jgi:hypothetical protein
LDHLSNLPNLASEGIHHSTIAMQTPAEPVLGPSLPVFANWQRLGGYAQLNFTGLHYFRTATPFCAKPLIMPHILSARQTSFFGRYSGVDATLLQHCSASGGTPYA